MDKRLIVPQYNRTLVAVQYLILLIIFSSR